MKFSLYVYNIFSLLVLSLGFHGVISGSSIEYVDSDEYPDKASLETLNFVAIVGRHGSRAPLYTYPNDPYPYTDNRFWPMGKGELTNLGKNQLYSLGSKIRKRYSGYLPELYYPNDTIAKYNPNNRDFESVSCLLASLYPPVGREVWNQQLMWQPIPSSVYNFDVSELLVSDKCPGYRIQAYKNAAMYNLKVFKNTTCLLKYVSNHTGQLVISPLQLTHVTDPLIMQEENGFKLPAWTEEVYPKELVDIYVHSMNALYSGSDRILSFTAGPELQHILNLLNMKINGSMASNTKLYIEMSHDTTLYALLTSMGSPFGQQLVRTSAYVVFELHKFYSSYIVQVLYYKDYSDTKPVYINIKDCPSPCSVENFSKFVQKVSGSTSWETACKKTSIF